MNADHYDEWPILTKEELVEAAYDVTGGALDGLAPEKLARLCTVASHVFDLCLNEIERRGLLGKTDEGVIIVPYCSEHAVETALTRQPQ